VEARLLSEKMSSSLLVFMKSGNPNSATLPGWPIFTAKDRETMVVNDPSEAENDSDGAAGMTVFAAQ
jgi:para-nitrobenzyl esterase